MQKFDSIQPQDLSLKHSFTAVTVLFNSAFTVMLFLLSALSYSYLSTSLVYSDLSLFYIPLINSFYLAFCLSVTLYINSYLALYKYLDNDGISKMVCFNVALISAIRNIYYFFLPLIYITLLFFVVHLALLDLHLYLGDSLGIPDAVLAFLNYFPLVFIFLIFFPHAGLWINSIVLRRFANEYNRALSQHAVQFLEAKSMTFRHLEALKYLVFNFFGVLLAYLIVIILVAIISFLCIQTLFIGFISPIGFIFSEPWMNLLHNLPFLYATFSVLMFVIQFYYSENF